MVKRNQDDERLGMFRNITRRDFLQGTALALAAPSWARGQSPSIPPSGFQGQDDTSTSRGHRVRDDVFRELPNHVVDTGEAYDLIVVGAGLAGLAAPSSRPSTHRTHLFRGRGRVRLAVDARCFQGGTSRGARAACVMSSSGQS